MSFGPVEPAPPRRPATVSAATALVFVVVALSLLSTVLSAVVFPDLQRAAEEAPVPAGMSADSVKTLATVGALVGGCGTLVYAVGLSVLAFFVNKGRNGARITMWIVGGLIVCCGLGGTVSQTFTANSSFGKANAGVDLEKNLPDWYQVSSVALQVLMALCMLIALILLALPASHPYFRKPEQAFVYPPGYPAYPAYPPQPGQPYTPPAAGHPQAYPPQLGQPPAAPPYPGPQPGQPPAAPPYPGPQPGQPPAAAPHPGPPSGPPLAWPPADPTAPPPAAPMSPPAPPEGTGTPPPAAPSADGVPPEDPPGRPGQ